MCELLAISASAPVDTGLSLARLVAHGGPAGQRDGWGIAFADGRDAHVTDIRWKLAGNRPCRDHAAGKHD